MIRDRGTIKWNSLMLPEHVKMLQEWMDEDEKSERIQLDEQMLERFDEITLEAVELKQTVLITYVSKDRDVQLIGQIRSFDHEQKQFQITDQLGNEQKVKLRQIKQLQVVE